MRRVLFSSFLGSAVEFYDFLLYGTAAALVFGQLFFSDLSPVVATIASFGTLAVGYVVRPLGGVIFGHFGDRIGRKSMLVLTMSIMGAASFAIGLLPTYATIGVLAPILLILLRLIQGFAVGGEWGGAALMALEHSDENKRGFSASFANMGAPAGAVLSTVVLAIVTLLPDDAFLSWGWRIPFLLSAVLVGIGLYVRLKVTESPLFEQEVITAVASEKKRLPIIDVLRNNPTSVLLGIGAGLGAFALQALMATFALTIGVQGGLTRSTVLWLFAAGSFVQIFALPALRRPVRPDRPPPGHDRRLHRRDHRGLPHPAAHRLRLACWACCSGSSSPCRSCRPPCTGRWPRSPPRSSPPGTVTPEHPWATSCPPPSAAASPRSSPPPSSPAPPPATDCSGSPCSPPPPP